MTALFRRALALGAVGLAGTQLVALARQHRQVRRAAPDLRVPAAYLSLNPSPAMLTVLRKAMPLLRAPATPDAIPVAIPTATGSLSAFRYEPTSGVPRGAVLWIHGGGRVMGAPMQDHALAQQLADASSVTVPSTAYRLAPEHPFPAALDDCAAALTWLREHCAAAGVPTRIAVGGASAGGGLAAELAQWALDHDVPVDFQLLLYPMLDDRTLDHGPGDRGHLIWTPEANRLGWTAYLGHPAGEREDRPYAVAARRADLTGLPPAWIGVGDSTSSTRRTSRMPTGCGRRAWPSRSMSSRACSTAPTRCPGPRERPVSAACAAACSPPSLPPSTRRADGPDPTASKPVNRAPPFGRRGPASGRMNRSRRRGHRGGPAPATHSKDSPMTSQTTTVHAPGTTAGPESTVRVPRQLQLAAAWTSFMCLYIYVDVLGLYKPGAVAGILEGTVHTFRITQTFFAGALAASAVPIMMILLSTTLAPRANRWTNLVVAALLIPWMAFNLSGGEWLLYYGLGFALELVILLWIVRTSWRWRVASAVPSLKR